MNLNKKTILITGAAGFIGAALSEKLLKEGANIIGVDNLCDYYDPKLKLARLNKINDLSKTLNSKWEFQKISIEDFESLDNIFKKHKPEIVVNLAAQAGVRYSLINPSIYFRTNLLGFGNVLECCRINKIEHLIFASSSSVYGGNKSIPFKESQTINKPISLYAATKSSNELMAYTYSQNYKIPSTGLRFFTVYGPWGRPDMAPIIFAQSICEGKIIKVNNFGKMKRDFTYIEDIVEGVYRCCLKPATPIENFLKDDLDSLTSSTPFRVFNIGNSKSIDLVYFIKLLEENLKKKAILEYVPLPIGEVIKTESDTSLLEEWINFKPKIDIENGVMYFIKWFNSYFKN